MVKNEKVDKDMGLIAVGIIIAVSSGFALWSLDIGDIGLILFGLGLILLVIGLIGYIRKHM